MSHVSQVFATAASVLRRWAIAAVALPRQTAYTCVLRLVCVSTLDSEPRVRQRHLRTAWERPTT